MKKSEILFELIDTEDKLIQDAKDNLLITENDINATVESSNIWLSAMKILVNVINDNKDKYLDSLSITSTENTLMVWSSYSCEAFSDSILS